jgi:Rieske [2Fe-2S] domain
VGLLYAHCAHRGTSLFYGRVEDRGIRCCYHGWLFDTQGRCLDQPCEPQGGAQRDSVRQPWYPTQERYGLVFAYLGPPARMPFLPRIDRFENLGPDQELSARCDVAGQGYGDKTVPYATIPYNWFQFFENVIDHFHVWVLHSNFTQAQFSNKLAALPTVEFAQSGASFTYSALRTVDGRKLNRVGQAVLPNVSIIAPAAQLVPGPARKVVWAVPVDETNFLPFEVAVGTMDGELDAVPMTPDGKVWGQMSEAEHQAYPGDFEAQASQGLIARHSEEHLVQSDKGVIMLRRAVLKQVATVREGGDPIGVAFAEQDAWLRVEAGNYFSNLHETERDGSAVTA